MATGACGIDCAACRLHRDGKCSSCGPGGSEEASCKLAAQVRLLGAPCPMLECAHSRRVSHCLRDCDAFPCQSFRGGPYPFSDPFLLMQERRRQTVMTPQTRPNPPQPVDPTHWKDLEALSPDEVTVRCRCSWDPGRGYGVSFLGETYWVHPANRAVEPERPDAPLESYLPMVLVLFLLKARDLPLDGRQVTERELPGGDFFFRHLHRLPTQPLEEAFGRRPDAFLAVGRRLGATPTALSDASFQITPLPRLPVGIHLWTADEEFPARCVYTFDASAHRQLPLDIIFALVIVLVQRILALQEE